jgi:glutamate racemase
MADNRPVGIFDSGLGGLTVLQSLVSHLPEESFFYLADSAFCPYGDKPVEAVQERTVLITEFLMERGAKAVVVACNTATAAAIDLLRGSYSIPFIGIEPAIKQAALHTLSGKVGVLATRNTFQGKLFQETSAKYANDKDVYIQVGEGLVELVEGDLMNTPESIALINHYIQPMIEAGVDQIVLGCTHYPFLIPVIRSLVPDNVVIHDPSPAVAKHTAHVLQDKGLESVRKLQPHQFFTTGNPLLLKTMIQRMDLGSGNAVSHVSI